MRSYYSKRVSNQTEAQMTNPTLGINMYNTDSEIGDNHLSNAINAYAYKNESVVLDAGSVYDSSIDLLFPDLTLTGVALTADMVLVGATTYLVMLRLNTDDTLSILSINVHTKAIVHNISIDAVWADVATTFKGYSCVYRTETTAYVAFYSPDYDDMVLYKFAEATETVALAFNPKRMVTHLNRLFAIDTSYVFWWSGAGQPTNWYTDDLPDDYVLENAGVWCIHTEPILSDLIVLNNNLYIFAPNNIYVFRGTDYPSFNLELTLTGFGISPNNDYTRLTATSGHMFFVDRDEIYQFSGDSYPTVVSRPVQMGGQIVNGVAGGIPRMPNGTFFDGDLWADDTHVYFHLGREYYTFDVRERTWWRSAGFDIGNDYTGTSDIKQVFFYNFTTNKTQCVVSKVSGATSKFAPFKRLYLGTDTAYLESKAYNSMPSHEYTLTNIIIECATHVDNEEEYTQIWTAADWAGLSIDLNGKYILKNNIELESFDVIGSYGDPFTGVFISNGFWIYYDGVYYYDTSFIYGTTNGYNPFFYTYWSRPQTGDGSVSNPYQIWTAQDLDNVRDELDAAYIQMADIDLSQYNWVPIGDNESSFTGQYNGNNYGIYNMYCAVSSSDYSTFSGLFGPVDNATIKNIYLYNPTMIIPSGTSYSGLISGYTSFSPDCIFDNCHAINSTIESDVSDESYDGYCGGLFGSASGTISNCTFSGRISDKYHTVGGICAHLDNGSISNCGVYKYISTDKISVFGKMGGIASYIGDNTIIDRCCVKTDILGRREVGGYSRVFDIGGIVNESHLTANIKDCYFSGTITVDPPIEPNYNYSIAGIVAQQVLYERCYSSGKLEVQDSTKLYHPICGRYLVDQRDAYYDADVYSGYDTNEFYEEDMARKNGVPKTTAQMKSQATYSGWDFSSVWGIDPALNNGYPYLLWEVL